MAEHTLYNDYKKILALAYPVVLSNAVDTIMMMVDRLFLARVSSGAGSEVLLGGAMGGGVIAWLAQAPLTGLLLYTNAMSSQNFGRGKLPRCSQVAAQGSYWVLFYYPLMLAFVQGIPLALQWMGHAPELAAAEWQYSQILIYGALFSLLRIPLNSFFIATNRSRLVMKVAFIGMALNIPLNYLLIFDIPQFLPAVLRGGIRGAAVATVAAQFLTFSLLFILFLRQKSEYAVAQSWRWHWGLHSELLRFGLPATLEGFLTSFSFNIFLMLFNSLGPVVAAAGTITFSWDLCNFIVIMGIGTATTTLMGQSLGAGDITQARRYTKLILIAAIGFSAFISLWFIFTPDLLSSVFITEAAEDPAALLELSRKMLRLAALYLLADALGVVMRGALNGAGDTLAVMLISVSVHIVLLLGSIFLLKILGWGALQVWSFFIFFVLLSNSSFALRYARGKWAKHWETPR